MTWCALIYWPDFLDGFMFLHIELLKSVENIGISTNLYNQKGIPGVIFPHAHYIFSLDLVFKLRINRDHSRVTSILYMYIPVLFKYSVHYWLPRSDLIEAHPLRRFSPGNSGTITVNLIVSSSYRHKVQYNRGDLS